MKTIEEEDSRGRTSGNVQIEKMMRNLELGFHFMQLGIKSELMCFDFDKSSLDFENGEWNRL